ncbi:YciI family protein [Planctomycetota bacterium]|nr:YciI family protein [Planctomycetota bacterium]
MPHFVVTIGYIKPMDIVEEHTPAHRDFCATLDTDGVLKASGPFSPRTGGMLICEATDKAALEALLAKDPFWVNKVASYDIREWVVKVGADLFAGS